MTSERAEVIVVGAGPAGLSAAIEAARSGADVVVVDENDRPGGQIFRQLPDGFRVTDARALGREYCRGQELFATLAEFPIRFMLGTTVWGMFDDRTLDVVTAGQHRQLQGSVIVLATGAYDRPVPLPGWTLPGVLTVGGAQTILKSQRMIAGRRILMAGTGPLQLVVASQLAQSGANLVAVVEAVSLRRFLPHVSGLAANWPITRDGVAYRWSLIRRRVPWIAPAILVRIDGTSQVEQATIARIDRDWRPIAGSERTFQVDTVCIGYGLVPSIELPRLCGCAVEYHTPTDTWIVVRNEDGETTVPGVFAVGDGAGVSGALVAAEEGRIAGLAVARSIGRLTPDEAARLAAPIRARLEKLAVFRGAMDTIHQFGPGLHELATADTVICRCEEVCAGVLKSAVDEGAQHLNQLKAWTRAGMGLCQARMCGLPTAQLAAAAMGVPVASLGLYSARPPAKPVPIDMIVE